MLNDMMKELRSEFDELRHGTETTTLHIAKPYCAPCRGIIEPVLRKYGVNIYDYSENIAFTNLRDFARKHKIEMGEGENISYGSSMLPLAMHADVTVSRDAAAWAEYLLLRTGKLYVRGRYVNRRNQEWAARHGGKMPPAWGNGDPWIEAGCKQGMQQWLPLKQAAQKNKEKRK